MKIILAILLLAILPILSYAQNPTGTTETKNNARIKPLPITPKGGLQKATPLNTTPSEVKEFTQLEKNTIASRAQLKEKQAKEQAIYEKYLGISGPASPQFAAKKAELYNNNPQAYKQFTEELNVLHNKSAKRTLSREKYNSLPQEEREKVDNFPDKYEIID